MTVHLCRDLPLGPYSSGSYDTMWAVNAFMQGVIGYTRVGGAGNIQPPGYADFVVPYYSASLSNNQLTQISSSVISIHTASCFMSGSGSTALVVFSTDTVNLMSAAFPVGWPVASGPWPGLFFGSLVAGQGNIFLGQWLAIKSAQFPLANSGLFVVTAASASLPQNAVVIDYRSPSAVLPETTQELTCSVWLPPPGSDTAIGVSGRGISRTGGAWGSFIVMLPSAVASTTYTTQGGAPNARVLLQSPDPSGYQVRLCIEKPTDQQYGQVGGWVSPSLTMMPGFSGSGGDFPNQTYANPKSQPHLHASQWFNNYVASNGNPLVGGALIGHDIVNVADAGVGGSHTTSQRFYAWGDDKTGSCIILTRGHGQSPGVNQVYDAFTAFGLPEDETQPLPPNDVSRLFVIGQNQANFNRISWDCGSYSANGVSGLAYSLDMKYGPISCTMSQYVYASIAESDGIYGGSYPTPRFDSAAADTPFLSAMELISVDLIAGTWGNLWAANVNYGGNNGGVGGLPAGGLNVEPRRLGRFPIARLGWATGRAAWITVDPGMTWFHAAGGFYLPWGGIGSN